MEKQVSDLIKKVNEIKNKEGFDLSLDEDLSIALMNLISIEEHLYFTAMKTNKHEYLETLQTARDIRKNLLKEIVKEPEGEVWCTSKHLLAASMRLIEVGNKYYGKDYAKAQDIYAKAFELYFHFWQLNINKNEKKATYANSEITSKDSGNENINKPKNKISAYLKGIIDCCKE